MLAPVQWRATAAALRPATGGGGATSTRPCCCDGGTRWRWRDATDESSCCNQRQTMLQPSRAAGTMVQGGDGELHLTECMCEGAVLV